VKEGTTVRPAVSPEDAPSPAAELKIIREKDRPPAPTPTSAAELTIVRERLDSSACGLSAAPGSGRAYLGSL
jgi:hypothetical protein